MQNSTKDKIFLMFNGFCPGRSLDVSKIKTYFKANNCKIIKNPAVADYIIFVTCAFCKRKETDNRVFSGKRIY